VSGIPAICISPEYRTPGIAIPGVPDTRNYDFCYPGHWQFTIPGVLDTGNFIITVKPMNHNENRHTKIYCYSPFNKVGIAVHQSIALFKGWPS